MRIKKLQMGGELSPEEEALMAEEQAAAQAQGGGEQDPLMMMGELAMQALETQDCEAAMGLAEMVIMLIQEMSGGGQAPQGGQEIPQFSLGGKILSK